MSRCAARPARSLYVKKHPDKDDVIHTRCIRCHCPDREGLCIECATVKCRTCKNRRCDSPGATVCARCRVATENAAVADPLA